MIRPDQQNGFILMPVVLAIVLIATTAFLLNNQSAINVTETGDMLEAKQAEQLTRAGLAHAVWGAQNSGCTGDMSMTSVPFGQGSYTATVDAAATTTNQYNFNPDHDATILESSPAAIGGSDTELKVKEKTSFGSTRSLLHYDLSTIPAGARVTSATAWFYVTLNNNVSPVYIHPVTESWLEASATWDSVASSFGSLVYGTISPQSASGVWVSVNLAALVQSWVNDASTNHGIMLIGFADDLSTQFTSSEYSTTNLRPYLQVTTAVGDVSPLSITATGTLAGNPSPANDILRTLTRTNVPAYQPNSITFMQPGTEGMDSYIYEWKSAWNYGVNSEIWVENRYANSIAKGLLKFDLSNVPYGARVVSAELELYQTNVSLGGGSVGVHRLTSSWTEGTQNSGNGSPNWTQRDAGIPWASVGGDYAAESFATTTVPSGSGWSTWDIADLVNAWVSGESKNEGLMLVAETFGTAAHFASSDAVDLTLHPKLTITYACECGGACMAPQGSGNLLLVVGDDITLAPSDVYKKALFEEWGYSVDLIDDQASQLAFDTAEANHDVAYISESSDPNLVWDKLIGATIGVVNEEGETNSHLGTATSSSYSVAKDLDVIDTSHYITALFPTGMLPIYSVNMENLLVSGTLAADLQTLGSDFYGAPGLAVVEVGGLLADGSSTAAGRRVTLPLGREVSFNWDYLNANGRLMVQRAIQWGTGNTGGAPPKNLLMVVVDPGNLTLSELGKKTQVESWDYIVSVIDESDSQSAFDAALANNDVVYISEEAMSTEVGTKLIAATIGVVTEEDNLSDEFGLSDGIQWQTGTTIDIVSNAHYITETFSLGSLTVLNTSQNVADLTGALAPDLQILANSAPGPALVAVSTGATIIGGTAAGRRVQLPWGDNPFEITHLTADGLTLFERALAWAAGTGIGNPFLPIAHWKLDDSGGIAVDSEGGHDGTLAGDPMWSTGTLNGALDFDGAGDLVDVGPILDAGSPQISVMAWVFKRDSGDDRVISKSSGAAIEDHIFSLGVAGTTVRARLRTTDNGGTSNYDGGSMPLDQWVHLAFTYNGGMLRIYMDGAETASYAVTGDMIASTLDVAIGNVNATDDRYWNGLLDDVRIYDRALDPVDIADLAASGGGGGAGYTELYQTWSATGDDTWQTTDLGVYGVPADAVVEVAVVNSDTGGQYFGGVRAVGSSLERRFQLHEAEGGGVDAVTLHVQADASSQIQHYSDKSSGVSFILLGYWTGASYVELFDVFSADSSNSWVAENLGDDGLGPNQIAEIAIVNTDTGAERLAGVRDTGASYQRRFNIHEAESGGVDTITMMVNTDASSSAEVYASNNSDIDFYVLGYWSTPPGSYTEAGGVFGQATTAGSWETADLSGFGIPANSIAQFVLSNERTSDENQMGVRQTGSAISNRYLDIQEAESGGGDLGTMHVNVDASSQIQWTVEHGATDGFLYPVGWWILP